jgi:hypothetical protein
LTLQNRVDPWGRIIATPERGTMMGNRGGKFHKSDQTLSNRHWASTHWICCELHWKDSHHEPMGQGYTSLFFLDEVTALSAGHRPCFFCRRKEAKEFLGLAKVAEFDKNLHTERLSPNFILRFFGEDQSLEGPLPEGAMLEIESAAYALKGRHLLLWSFGGYTDAQPLQSLDRAKLLTPPSIIAILAKGYKPRWHESAKQWDAT